MGNDLSSRDSKLVDAFIDDICHWCGLSAGRADKNPPYYHSIGWIGFLTVYRRNPESFRFDGRQGWSCAGELIRQGLLRERRALYRTYFGERSLDAPISVESCASLLALLPSQVDIDQDAVCLQGFLERLEEKSRDGAALARRLIEGDSPEEARATNRWSRERFKRAYGELRAALEKYRAL